MSPRPFILSGHLTRDLSSFCATQNLPVEWGSTRARGGGGGSATEAGYVQSDLNGGLDLAAAAAAAATSVKGAGLSSRRNFAGRFGSSGTSSVGSGFRGTARSASMPPGAESSLRWMERHADKSDEFRPPGWQVR